MAIGAVALSFPLALFGSLYMSVLNGLMLWQGLAAYSLLGFLALSTIFLAAALDTNHGREAGVHSRRL